MPVKYRGISERLVIPRAGNVRIGKKVPSRRNPEKMVPTKLDHFRFDPKNPDLLSLLLKTFGEKPKSLPIMLVQDDEHPWDKVFPHYLKLYGTGERLKCMSDGEKVIRRRDENNKFIDGIDEVCDPDTCKYFQNKQCKLTGSLQFIIMHPDLPSLCVWQISTTGVHSTQNFLGNLWLLKQGWGRINGIPLVLSVYPQMFHPEGKSVPGFVLSLDLNPEYADIIPRQLAFGQTSQPALPSPELDRIAAGEVDIPEATDGDGDDVELLFPETKEASTSGEVFPGFTADMAKGSGPDVTAKPIFTLEKEGDAGQDDQPNPLHNLPADVQVACDTIGWDEERIDAELSPFVKDGVLQHIMALRHVMSSVDTMIVEREAKRERKATTRKSGEEKPPPPSDPAGGILDF